MTNKRHLIVLLAIALVLVVIAVTSAQQPEPLPVQPLTQPDTQAEAAPSFDFDVEEMGGCRNWSDADAIVRNSLDATSGDTNNDGVIDRSDLNLVNSAYGLVVANHPADVNNDGRVNLADLNLVGLNFGRTSSRANTCDTRLDVVDGNGIPGLTVGETFALNVFTITSSAANMELTYDGSALAVGEINALPGALPQRLAGTSMSTSAISPQSLQLPVPAATDGRVMTLQMQAMRAGTFEIAAGDPATGLATSMMVTVADAPQRQQEPALTVPSAPLPVPERQQPEAVQQAPQANAPLPVAPRAADTQASSAVETGQGQSSVIIIQPLPNN